MYNFGLTINGRTRATSQQFSVNNPSTGKPAGMAPEADGTTLDLAVESAQKAFLSWSNTEDTERKNACIAVAETLMVHQEELAQIITSEQGKPLNGLGSRWEVGGAAAWAQYTASLDIPVKVIQDDCNGRVEAHRKPLGVIGSITPWNYPVLIAIWHIVPAIRTGNTVVIKPSENTPLSTLRMVEIINTVLPPGVVNVVTSSPEGENLGAKMSSHPNIHKIVFTGSCATGQKVMASAARTMKRLTLEMGGNDAGIVLADADPSTIAEGLFWGAFVNSGQTCAAMKRLYVHESIHDEVCEALVAYAKNVPLGSGQDNEALLGPIQNQVQFDIVKRLVDQAKEHGEVLLGGEPMEGLYFQPTIIANLNNGDPLVDEEQFGPALPIIKYSNVDDAIAFANASDNGLGGSIWTSNIESARALASRLECGSVWINKHGALQPNAPFGGIKKSGLGVEFAEEGLLEYTDIQVLFS